jgi:glyoxylase-like metal-dependent hydrolase (beta-lactamase superfamily II)
MFQNQFCRFATLTLMSTATMLVAGCAASSGVEDLHMIGGSFPETGGPDGDTYIYDSPDGLIVIDTGRHIEHSQAILDYAKARKRPIAAIVNTHWHLDHTTGNADLRAVYPNIKVYATRAAEGALDGFLAESVGQIEPLLDDPTVTGDRRAGLERAMATIRNRTILATDPVDHPMKLAVNGRSLEIELTDHAVTEADLWIWDAATKTAIIGDIITVPAPFFDTACPAGWSAAFDAIARKPIERVAPGHGPLLSRAEFDAYRGAFDNLLACAAAGDGATCAAGWLTDAAAFIPDGERVRARDMVVYYVDEIIRSPQKHAEFCPAT